MKKLISLLLTVLLAAAGLTTLSCAAASDFVVEDGVLVRYTGSAAEVTVPDGVYAVGDGAFEGNKSVKKVVLPATVYSIGNRAFYNCASLTQVTGKGVASVGVFAFNGTPYFDQSTAEFFTLGSCLLWYNGSASRVTLPAGITSVAPFAFLRYEGLSAFSAPDGLVSVGEGAFYECKALTSVNLPATVSYIGAAAFDGTAYLSGASGFTVLGDGILIRYSGTDQEVTVPDGVRRIAGGAFSGNTHITSLTLPASVYSADGGACENCTKLSSLSLSRGLVYIGEHAFAGCTALVSLQTPATLTYIGEGAFERCGLRSVSLKGTKLMVGADAFQNCAALSCVLMSSGVYALSDGAFSGCGAMHASISPDTMVIGRKSFSGNATVWCNERSFASSPLFGYTVSCKKGDADGDGTLTILDATRIRRYLVGLASFGARELCAADMDYDAGVSIVDATRVQRILAGLV